MASRQYQASNTNKAFAILSKPTYGRDAEWIHMNRLGGIDLVIYNELEAANTVCQLTNSERFSKQYIFKYVEIQES